MTTNNALIGIPDRINATYFFSEYLHCHGEREPLVNRLERMHLVAKSVPQAYLVFCSFV